MVWLKLRSLLRRGQVEAELDEELRYHLEREIEENIGAGMSPEEARHAALRAMGGLEQRKEECRDMRGVNWVETILNDLRHSARQLRKNPSFAATAVLMLTLGMCSSIAIYAFVDASLLKPLPYENPGRLLGVFERIESWCPRCNLSWPDYLDWKKQNTTLASLDVYQQRGYTLTGGTGAVPIRGARVSDGFFRTLGVAPVLGRDFLAGEDQAGAARTVILSYAMWQRQFGGQANVLGQTLVVDRIPRVIVGVLPSEFQFAPVGRAEIWMPFHPEGSCDLRRSCHSIYGVGRLKDGVSAEAALANLVSIAKALEKTHPDSNRNQGANVAPLGDVISGDIKPVLVVLMAGAALLLLIAIVDVAGLLLVRSENRKREFAVRLALGATTTRLLSQFVTEALVVVVTSCALSVVASHWAIQLLKGLLSEDMLAGMPYLEGMGWNWRLAAFACVISALAAAIFAIAPSLRLRLPAIGGGLADGARGSGGVWRKLGSKLVVVELAAAVVLLVGAGLLGRSLSNLLRVRLGLQPDHLVTLAVAAPRGSYGEGQQAMVLTRKLVEQVSHLPGVRAVSLCSNGVPLSHNGNTTWIRVIGRPWNGEHIEVAERDVASNYFNTLGAKLERGRYFEANEDASKPQVAIINQAFARAHFPNEDPIGKQISGVRAGAKPAEIVGVVEDLREGPLSDAIPPVLYRPFNQDPDNYFSLIVRTWQNDGSILPTLGSVVRQIDPEIVTMQGKTMQERLEDSPAAYRNRSAAWLTAGFAGLALLLALVGLYGVVAYSVSQRTREIGIRVALGAEGRMVRGMILREAARLSGVGIVAGLLCAALAGRFLRSLLFGVSPWDPATMLVIALLLGAASLTASLIPARRAATVNPVEALRAD